MRTLKICLQVIILLSVALWGTTSAAQQGEPVANFSLANLDNGDLVTPQQYKGKVLVLFFVGFN